MIRKQGKLDHRSLTERLMEAYAEPGGLTDSQDRKLPDLEAVYDLVEQLRGLVFPGFHGPRVQSGGEQLTAAVERAEALLVRLLVDTFRYCQRADCGCDSIWGPADLPEDSDTFAERARTIAGEYLSELPDIRRMLIQDVQAAFRGDPAASNTEEIILCYPGLTAITVHRLAHPLYGLGVPLLPRIMSEWAHHQSGVDIHPGARIGERFFIDHGTGVVIGETTEIGQDVKLYQGVTLGALSFPRNPDGSLVKGGKRHPTIGDRVTIYANATILGGETLIGNDAVIGGGTWVTASVPAEGKVLPGS